MNRRSFSSCKSSICGCGLCDDMGQCHAGYEGYAQPRMARMARVAHAERGTQSAHIARMGYTGCGVAERLFAVRRQRPVAACMVKNAPRKGGAPAWRTQGEWSGPGLAGGPPRAICPLGMERRGGEKDGCLECGRRGGELGARRGLGPSRGECSRSLSDLHLTAVSNILYTQSNISEFVTT